MGIGSGNLVSAVVALCDDFDVARVPIVEIGHGMHLRAVRKSPCRHFPADIQGSGSVVRIEALHVIDLPQHVAIHLVKLTGDQARPLFETWVRAEVPQRAQDTRWSQSPGSCQRLVSTHACQ